MSLSILAAARAPAHADASVDTVSADACLPSFRCPHVDAVSPSRLRALALYSGGELSTFPHRLDGFGRTHSETLLLKAPFDRRMEDEWLAFDKVQHFAFSFLFTLGTQYIAVNKGGFTEHRALPLSITTSAVIGVTKEYYDLRVGPTQRFSKRDLVADAAGILFAVGVIVL